MFCLCYLRYSLSVSDLDEPPGQLFVDVRVPYMLLHQLMTVLYVRAKLARVAEVVFVCVFS